MKKKSLLLYLTLFISGLSYSQDNELVRGAIPGELYLTGSWYGVYDANWGPPYYDTLNTAIYRLTENGKLLTIQYDVDYFADYYTEPGSIMQPHCIMADVTLGVVYSYRNYYKNSYEHCQLWISFDYGKNWVFREEDIGRKAYAAANKEKLSFRGGGDGLFKSNDFGLTYENIPIPTTKYGVIGRTGLDSCEFWNILGSSAYSYQLVHTIDCRKTHTVLPIDSQYMFGQISGMSPSVYRGGLSGEVYISSLFPDGSYKVSFSADTGHTFRHVYVANDADCSKAGFPVFMSDREPGVFYIVKQYSVEDVNPWGWHSKICVEYYRDYGETLEATFCHDIHKNYEYEEVLCENITHLSANVEQNTIQLQWVNLADNIRGYHVYRNDLRITNQMLTEPVFLDENLPIGNYEYYVRTYYIKGCVSDSSNHVTESVGLGVKGVKELEGVRVWPNPTTGQLTMDNGQWTIKSVEIFDIYGRNVTPHTSYLTPLTSYDLTVLQSGVYFFKIFDTENNSVVKRVVVVR